MLQLTAAVERSIRAHAERTYPHECCGLLLGTFGADARRASATHEIANAREESARHNRYLITADDYRLAEAEGKARGLDVVGFYHSHPDHPARPSGFDLEHASFPWFSYAIVAVEKGRSAALNSFVMRDDRSRFDDERLEIEGS